MRILGFKVRVIETLIAVNALVFLAAMVFPKIVIPLLAISPVTVFFMPWTILSSMFLHADLMHIIFNMMALYFFGLYLENLVGERNLLKVFFLGGIFGSICYVLGSILLGNLNSFAMGASGGIFAIAGALAVLRPNMRVFMIPIPIAMPLYIAVFVVMVLLSFMPGVAWQDHFGGLIVGVLFGLYWRNKVVEIIGVKEKYGYRFY